MMMQKQQGKWQADEAALMSEWRTCWQEKHAEYPCRTRTAVQKAGRWSWKKFCARRSAFERESKIKHQPAMEHTESVRETIAGFVYGSCEHMCNHKYEKRILQAQQAQMDAGDAKRPKPRKRGFFTSLIFV